MAALAPPRGARPIAGFFRVVRQGQTYRNLIYLLTAFPLGLLYFIALITLFSVGMGLVIVWVGLPMLVATVALWRGFGAFERELAIWWLRIPIGPLSTRLSGKIGVWNRLQLTLRDPLTWKSLLFVFAKFPLGVVAFASVVGLLTSAIALFGTPIVFFASIPIGASSPAWLKLVMLITLILSIPFGVLTLHLLNGATWLWGQFAQYALGQNDGERQLAEARAETRRAQAQAARADQSRRELIVNASHELRTPIASIRGHVESLLMADDATTSSPAEQRAYLEIVARETDRLGALVDDLMALARVDANELRLDILPTDALAATNEVYDALAPLARREREITLVREASDGLPLVLADRARLVQVLLNLVRNAITYTPAGGLVSLMLTQPDPQHLAITVADTGIGIPPADLARIFDRFYRTDASRARATGGFGLGLSIVRDLVQAMGGTVAVSSTIGEGSRFTVTLRVA